MPTYTGISSEAFRHPLDAQAEQALRSVPGFDMIARKFVEFAYERPRHLFLMGNSIEVGPRQYSSVYHLFRECVRDLDVSPEPTIFVSQSPSVNAYALGQEKPCVVLNTALLDLMSEVELKAAIAHELGHLKCGHTTLNQMATWAINLATGLTDMTFGLSTLVSTGLMMSFYEWLRKAELSADRAALLVLDDPSPVLHSMMRLAGGSSRYANEVSLPEFIAQAKRYEGLHQDGLNQVYKFLLYNNLPQGVFLTHPFALERVQYLQEWSVSEEYQQIRNGNYRRTGEGAVDVAASSDLAEVAKLQREVEELQREIDRVRKGNS